MASATYVVAVFRAGTGPEALVSGLAAAIAAQPLAGSRFEEAETGATGGAWASPLGATVLRVAIPTSAFLSPERSGAACALAERILRVSADLGADLAWLTRFDTAAEAEFVDDAVLTPLLLEQPDDAIAPAFEWIVVGEPLFGKVASDPDWLPWWRSEKAIAFRRGISPNPWLEVDHDDEQQG